MLQRFILCSLWRLFNAALHHADAVSFQGFKMDSRALLLCGALLRPSRYHGIDQETHPLPAQEYSVALRFFFRATIRCHNRPGVAVIILLEHPTGSVDHQSPNLYVSIW